MKFLLLICVILALAFNTACSMRGDTSGDPCTAAPAPPVQQTAVVTPAEAEDPIPDTAVSYSYDGAGIRLSIPAGWAYEIDAHDAEMGQFSISFWPEAQPVARLEVVHYASPFGVCGTGLTTQAVAFANGLTGSMGTYAELDNWSYIAFEGDYVAHNQGIGQFWDAYGDQALVILGTAVFGEEAAQ